MKRLINLFLVGVLAVSMVACGASNDKSTNKTSEQNIEENQEEEEEGDLIQLGEVKLHINGGTYVNYTTEVKNISSSNVQISKCDVIARDIEGNLLTTKESAAYYLLRPEESIIITSSINYDDRERINSVELDFECEKVGEFISPDVVITESVLNPDRTYKFRINGIVEALSDMDLFQLKAIATLYDVNGEYIISDSELISLNKASAGDTSIFDFKFNNLPDEKLEWVDHYEIKFYNTLMGDEVETEEE